MTSTEALVAWMQGIITNDYAQVTEHTQKTWLKNNGNCGENWRFPIQADALQITEFESWKCNEVSPVMHWHTIKIKHKNGESTIGLNVIKEDGPYSPSLSGEWGVNPNSWRVIA